MWVDRERRYFIASVGTTNEGQTIYRVRWRREGNVTKKLLPKLQYQKLLRCTTAPHHKLIGITAAGRAI